MAPNTSEQEATELPLDTCLELLADRQRRVVLGYLIDAESDTASVDELVSEIADAEARATGERPRHDTIAAMLFHVHLPKLASAGVLEYETRHLDVRYRGDPKIVELYKTIREHE